ncbi:MAG: type IV pilus modification PilV family protein [Kiritimatiellia bacterium]|jgi:prepilin-type N-terminal cleavage/methylation domain-containing protein
MKAPFQSAKSGMTLVEVLLATIILATGLTALLTGLSSCLAVMRASRVVSTAQWVLGMGELKHPLRAVEELEELDIDGDTSIAEGFTFSRKVEEKEIADDDEDDGLRVVRTRVSWGSGKEGEYLEVVRLLWEKPEDRP